MYNINYIYIILFKIPNIPLCYIHMNNKDEDENENEKFNNNIFIRSYLLRRTLSSRSIDALYR